MFWSFLVPSEQPALALVVGDLRDRIGSLSLRRADRMADPKRRIKRRRSSLGLAGAALRGA